MPEICRFFGIIITMNYDDHAPPHFHVRYNEHKATFKINSLGLDKGSIPPRAIGMVLEWAAIHKEELAENWSLAETHKPLNKIKPLE